MCKGVGTQEDHGAEARSGGALMAGSHQFEWRITFELRRVATSIGSGKPSWSALRCRLEAKDGISPAAALVALRPGAAPCLASEGKSTRNYGFGKLLLCDPSGSFVSRPGRNQAAQTPSLFTRGGRARGLWV